MNTPLDDFKNFKPRKLADFADTIPQIIGKTVFAARQVDDEGDPYVVITFTDTSQLIVRETQQSGSIAVEFKE
jgi:hypothetical protein